MNQPTSRRLPVASIAVIGVLVAMVAGGCGSSTTGTASQEMSTAPTSAPARRSTTAPRTYTTADETFQMNLGSGWTETEENGGARWTVPVAGGSADLHFTELDNQAYVDIGTTTDELNNQGPTLQLGDLDIQQLTEGPRESGPGGELGVLEGTGTEAGRSVSVRIWVHVAREGFRQIAVVWTAQPAAQLAAVVQAVEPSVLTLSTT